MQNDLLEFSEALQATSSLKQTSDLLRSCVQKMGFVAGQYGYSPSPFSENMENDVLYLGPSYDLDDFQRDYDANGFAADDPAVAYCIQQTEPIVWSDFDAKLPTTELTVRQQQLL